MDREGNLSSEAAPTILFHYTVLFNEWGIGPLKILTPKREWIESVFGIVDHEWNVAVLCPTLLEEQIDKHLSNYPFRRCYTYDDVYDIKMLGLKRDRYRIAYYVDDLATRGGYFGTAWVTDFFKEVQL